MSKSYTGISFPFRIGVKGGVVMSSTSSQEVPHIVESMQQILMTRPMERVMEYEVKSEISTFVFDPNDASTKALISNEVEQALAELEPRIEVLSVNPYVMENCIYATIAFKVKKYSETYSVNIKVGD